MPAPSLRACLICCLGGGLTNQENMVENCLALAALTGCHWCCSESPTKKMVVFAKIAAIGCTVRGHEGTTQRRYRTRKHLKRDSSLINGQAEREADGA